MDHRTPLLLCFGFGLALSPDPAHAVESGAGDDVIDDRGVTDDGDDRVEKIVQGEVTNDWPAVVALMEHGEPVCTGTLIAPRAVLTAAHCLDFGGPTHVYFGGSPYSGSGREVAVDESLPHPDYTGSDDALTGFDIGLVFLSADAPAQPRPVRSASAEPLVGEVITYVGFGDTQGTGGEGLKKEATARIVETYGDILDVQPESGSACYGDSGGPVFWDGDYGVEIVGVVSFGYTADCMDLGGNTRADLYYDWLDLHAAIGDGDWNDGVSGDDDDDDDDGSSRRPGRGNGCQASVVSGSDGPDLGWFLLAPLGLAASSRRRRAQAQA